jgi:hypothetical protein
VYDQFIREFEIPDHIFITAQGIPAGFQPGDIFFQPYPRSEQENNPEQQQQKQVKRISVVSEKTVDGN